jgi:hypothetical protein
VSGHSAKELRGQQNAGNHDQQAAEADRHPLPDIAQPGDPGPVAQASMSKGAPTDQRPLIPVAAAGPLVSE